MMAKYIIGDDAELTVILHDKFIQYRYWNQQQNRFSNDVLVLCTTKYIRHLHDIPCCDAKLTYDDVQHALYAEDKKSLDCITYRSINKRSLADIAYNTLEIRDFAEIYLCIPRTMSIKVKSAI